MHVPHKDKNIICTWKFSYNTIKIIFIRSNKGCVCLYLILGTSSSTIKSPIRKWCFAIRKRFITDSLTWGQKYALKCSCHRNVTVHSPLPLSLHTDVTSVQPLSPCSPPALFSQPRSPPTVNPPAPLTGVSSLRHGVSVLFTAIFLRPGQVAARWDSETLLNEWVYNYKKSRMGLEGHTF